MSNRKLKSVILDEISGVDMPAHPNATITLIKRGGVMTDEQKKKMKEYMDKGYSEKEARAMCTREQTMKGGDMDPQELAKQLEALEGQVADLTKRAETLEKSAKEAGFDVSEDGTITKRAEPEYVEIDGEKVEKSAVPAPILKRLEAQQAEITALNKRQHDIDLAKRGSSELPNLAGNDIAKGKLLEAVGEDEELLKALKAADAAVEKQMREIGSNVIDDESSATFRLNKMANAYASEKNVSFEIAYTEVTKSGEGAKLMQEARKEAN